MSGQTDRWSPGLVILSPDSHGRSNAEPSEYVVCRWLPRGGGGPAGTWVAVAEETLDTADAGCRLRCAIRGAHAAGATVVVHRRGDGFEWPGEVVRSVMPEAISEAGHDVPAARELAAVLTGLPGVVLSAAFAASDTEPMDPDQVNPEQQTLPIPTTTTEGQG